MRVSEKFYLRGRFADGLFAKRPYDKILQKLLIIRVINFTKGRKRDEQLKTLAKVVARRAINVATQKWF